MAQAIAALIAIARAIPALSSLCELLIGVLESWEKKRNEKVALERLEKKNSDVDARIDAIRMQSPPAEQQRKTDESTGLH